MPRKLWSLEQMKEEPLGIVGSETSGNRRSLRAAASLAQLAMERELTARQRECVELYYFQGLTEEQAARRLGVSKPTVCRHLQKARARLERALSYGAVRQREEWQ